MAEQLRCANAAERGRKTLWVLVGVQKAPPALPPWQRGRSRASTDAAPAPLNRVPATPQQSKDLPGERRCPKASGPPKAVNTLTPYKDLQYPKYPLVPVHTTLVMPHIIYSNNALFYPPIPFDILRSPYRTPIIPPYCPLPQRSALARAKAPEFQFLTTGHVMEAVDLVIFWGHILKSEVGGWGTCWGALLYTAPKTNNPYSEPAKKVPQVSETPT